MEKNSRNNRKMPLQWLDLGENPHFSSVFFRFCSFLHDFLQHYGPNTHVTCRPAVQKQVQQAETLKFFNSSSKGVFSTKKLLSLSHLFCVTSIRWPRSLVKAKVEIIWLLVVSLFLLQRLQHQMFVQLFISTVFIGCHL